MLKKFFSEPPKLFKIVIGVCLSIKGSIVAFLGVNSFVQPMPDTLVKISYYVLAACFVIAGFSQAQAKKDDENRN
jgi:hypothetical protein